MTGYSAATIFKVIKNQQRANIESNKQCNIAPNSPQTQDQQGITGTPKTEITNILTPFLTPTKEEYINNININNKSIRKNKKEEEILKEEEEDINKQRPGNICNSPDYGIEVFNQNKDNDPKPTATAQELANIDGLILSIQKKLKREYRDLTPYQKVVAMGILVDKKKQLEEKRPEGRATFILNMFSDNQKLTEKIDQITRSIRPRAIETTAE